MDGIFGWLGDHGADQDLIKQMADAANLSPDIQLHEHSSLMLGMAAGSRFGKATIHVEIGLAAALTGRRSFRYQDLAVARDRSRNTNGTSRVKKKKKKIVIRVGDACRAGLS